MLQTTVDSLTAKRLSLPQGFSRNELERAQMQLLRKSVADARTRSGFYAEHFAGIDNGDLKTRGDLCRLPFLTAKDIIESGHRMQCVSQSEVVRIITMQTSGSTGNPKRFSFTRTDIEAISEFFLEGMKNLVNGEDRVLVLLPYEQEASVGELLIGALGGGNIYAEGLWPPPKAEEIAARIVKDNISSVVGLPQQLLAVAEVMAVGQVRTMLLCSDYAPDALRKRIETLTGCTTFLHYGATESGLGGAVECDHHCGLHLRESDLLVEIVDPDTGAQLEDGRSGELVLSTLGREAMPLIRYRTGDMASLERSSCACGGITARLCNIYGRLKGCTLSDGAVLYNQLLDDKLFHLPGLLDYRVTLRGGGVDLLDIDYITTSKSRGFETQLVENLAKIAEIEQNIQSGNLELGTIQPVEAFQAIHTLKRTILDLR